VKAPSLHSLMRERESS